MSSKPRFKVVALAAGLVVLALGAGLFLMSGGQESSQAASELPVLEGPAKLKAQAGKRKTANPAARNPVSKPKPKIDPTLEKGLPSSVKSAFTGRNVVVVALYAPDVPLDQMAVGEARVGAESAGAGFVALNVTDESQARPLTKLLGVLEDPTVLVFKRPGNLFLRLTGYADQQTVAQAARNAAL